MNTATSNDLGIDRQVRLLEESVIELVIGKLAPGVYRERAFRGMTDVEDENGESFLEIRVDAGAVGYLTPWARIAEELYHRLDEKPVCIRDDESGLLVWVTFAGTLHMESRFLLSNLDSVRAVEAWVHMAQGDNPTRTGVL